MGSDCALLELLFTRMINQRNKISSNILNSARLVIYLTKMTKLKIEAYTARGARDSRGF